MHRPLVRSLRYVHAPAGAMFGGCVMVLWLCCVLLGGLAVDEPVMIVAPDARAGQWFGASVVAESGLAAAGAPLDDDLVAAGGAVYLFDAWRGWRIVSKLVAPDSMAHAMFGWAVAMDAEWLAVSAPGDAGEGGQAGTGLVRLYQRWSRTCFVLDAVIENPDGVAGAWWGFGEACELATDPSGRSLLAVSAPDATSVRGEGAGRVHLFVYGEDGWCLQTTLMAPDLGPHRHFGRAIDLDGRRLIVGAPGDPDYGVPPIVTIYVRRAAGWIRETTLTSDDDESTFGASIALADPWLAIGAPLQDGRDGEDVGAVHVYRRGDGWQRAAVRRPADLRAGDRFGEPVGLTPARARIRVFATARRADHAVGVVYDDVLGDPAPPHAIRMPGGELADGFGLAFAVTTSHLAIGAPYDDHDAGANAGSLWLFPRPCATDLDASGAVDETDLLRAIERRDAELIARVLKAWGPCDGEAAGPLFGW